MTRILRFARLCENSHGGRKRRYQYHSADRDRGSCAMYERGFSGIALESEFSHSLAQRGIWCPCTVARHEKRTEDSSLRSELRCSPPGPRRFLSSARSARSARRSCRHVSGGRAPARVGETSLQLGGRHHAALRVVAEPVEPAWLADVALGAVTLAGPTRRTRRSAASGAAAAR